MLRQRKVGPLDAAAALAMIFGSIKAGQAAKRQDRQDREDAEANREWLNYQRDQAKDQQERADLLRDANRLRSAAPYVAAEQGPELASRALRVEAGQLAENPSLRGMTPGQQRVVGVGAQVAIDALKRLRPNAEIPKRPEEVVPDLLGGLEFTRTPELTKRQDEEAHWLDKLAAEKFGAHPLSQVPPRDVYRENRGGTSLIPRTLKLPVPMPIGSATVDGPTVKTPGSWLNFGDPDVRKAWGITGDQLKQDFKVGLEDTRTQNRAYLKQLDLDARAGREDAKLKLGWASLYMRQGGKEEYLKDWVELQSGKPNSREELLDQGGSDFSGRFQSYLGAGAPSQAPGAPGAPAAAGTVQVEPEAAVPFDWPVTPPQARPALPLANPLTAPLIAPEPELAMAPGTPEPPTALTARELIRRAFPRGTNAQREIANKERDADTRAQNADTNAERQQATKTYQERMAAATEERNRITKAFNEGRLTNETAKIDLERWRRQVESAAGTFKQQFDLWKEGRKLSPETQAKFITARGRIERLETQINNLRQHKKPDWRVIDGLHKHLEGLVRYAEGLMSGEDAGAPPEVPNVPELPMAPKAPTAAAKPEGAPPAAGLLEQPHTVVIDGKSRTVRVGAIAQGLREANPKLTQEQAVEAAREWIRERRP